MTDYNINTQDLVPYLWTGGAGMLGRLMYRAKLAQMGQVKPLDFAILWDVCIALGMGWISLGICIWFELPQALTSSAAILAAYLGPYGLDLLFVRWVDSKFNKMEKETPDGKSGS